MAHLRSKLVPILLFAAVSGARAEMDPAQVDREIQKNLDFFYYMEVVEAQPMLKAFQAEINGNASPASLKTEQKSNRPSRKSRKGNGS